MQEKHLRYVERSSLEFKKFIERIEANFEASNKLSACLLCWGFITSYQRKKHLEHSHYTVTPSYFKNEESFIKLCKMNGKAEGDKYALFNEHCRILVGNPYFTPPPRAIPRSYDAYSSGGGAGPG